MAHTWLGPTLPKAYDPKGPFRPINTEGSSLPWDQPSRCPMGGHPCPGSIHAEGLFLPRAHQCVRPILTQDTSMPRVHPSPGPKSRGPMVVHPFLRPIPAQDTSIPRAHGNPSITRAHPCQGPIPAQCAFIPRAHGGHPCLGSIHAEGPFLPRTHLSR